MAVASGGTTHVASYSSTIHGPERLARRLDTRRRTGERRPPRGMGEADPGKHVMGNGGDCISNGIASAQRCCPRKTYCCCAHVVPEPTGDVVGLRDPVEGFLARTGGSNGGWDGRKLAVTQDACDHRFVGDGRSCSVEEPRCGENRQTGIRITGQGHSYMDPPWVCLSLAGGGRRDLL
jgi:hypothetical protein